MQATKEMVGAVLFFNILLFNVAGNSLVIYIITHERGTKTPTNYLLLNLAVADLLLGVFFFPYFVVMPILGRPSLPDGVLGDWLCKLFLFGSITILASRASVFTKLCLSVERYFAVCRPHSFTQRFSPRIVKVLVVMSWVYAAAMASLIFVDVHFSREYSSCILNVSTFKVYSVYSLVEIACGVSTMFFLPAKICISLWCKRIVEPTGEREIADTKKKKKVTLCVLAVLFTFVLSWIPVAVGLARYGLSIPEQTDFNMTVIPMFINAALDPYLFSFQSTKFKVLARKILCCRKEPVDRN